MKGPGSMRTGRPAHDGTEHVVEDAWDVLQFTHRSNLSLFRRLESIRVAVSRLVERRLENVATKVVILDDAGQPISDGGSVDVNRLTRPFFRQAEHHVVEQGG